MISFEKTVQFCLDTPEFMENYRRLRGVSLGLRSRSPIALMVDKATGREEKEMFELCDFIRDYVWLPVVTKQVP